MSQKIFAVFYNYEECEYSLIKLFSEIEKAYCYVCFQENSNFYENQQNYKMIEINTQDDLNVENLVEDELHVCFVKSGKYDKINVIDNQNVSQYIIAEMDLE